MEREFIPGFHFPPGFRFHPSDQELIKFYLFNKVNARQLPADVIAETDLYNYNPWDLPVKASFGGDEWYFFSPRYRKYPNGTRPNRMAASGFWKATGPDKLILNSSGSRSIGVKKALVFYTGRPPKGQKTEWVMDEYRLPNPAICPSRLRGSMRLDNWVLCRVRQKGNMSKNIPEAQGGGSGSGGGGGSPSQLAPAPYCPAPTELHSAQQHAIDNTPIISDALLEECPFVAKILAGHDLPPIKDVSTTFSSTNNSNMCDSVFKNDSSKGSTSVISSSFDSSFNPWKGKSSEGNENQETNPMNFFDQNQTQWNIFNPDMLNSAMNIEELDDSDFL